jgi:hypothetical protein
MSQFNVVTNETLTVIAVVLADQDHEELTRVLFTGSESECLTFTGATNEPGNTDDIPKPKAKKK